MKALIICSVYALCDISQFERNACNKACAQYGIPGILTMQDHARMNASTTMPNVLNHLPGSFHQRKQLIDSYLGFLNEDVWSNSFRAYKSVVSALMDPAASARQTCFVSDYPLLTTNLIRSAALLTNATKLGHVIAPSDAMDVPSISASLETAAASLKVSPQEIDVLVAHQRDFVAAQSLGMRPHFVAELQPSKQKSDRRIATYVPKNVAPIIRSVPIAQPAIF